MILKSVKKNFSTYYFQNPYELIFLAKYFGSVAVVVAGMLGRASNQGRRNQLLVNLKKNGHLIRTIQIHRKTDSPKGNLGNIFAMGYKKS